MRAAGCVPRHKAWLLRGHCARDPGPPALGAEAGVALWLPLDTVASPTTHGPPSAPGGQASLHSSHTALFTTNYKKHVKIKTFKEDDLKVETDFPRHPSR